MLWSSEASNDEVDVDFFAKKCCRNTICSLESPHLLCIALMPGRCSTRSVPRRFLPFLQGLALTHGKPAGQSGVRCGGQLSDNSGTAQCTCWPRGPLRAAKGGTVVSTFGPGWGTIRGWDWWKEGKDERTTPALLHFASNICPEWLPKVFPPSATNNHKVGE